MKLVLVLLFVSKTALLYRNIWPQNVGQNINKLGQKYEAKHSCDLLAHTCAKEGWNCIKLGQIGASKDNPISDFTKY